MDLCNHRILRSTNFKHMIPFFLEQEMFPLYRCSFANTIGKVLCRKTTKTQTHTHICSKGVSLPMINHSCVCVWGWSLGKQQKKTRGNLGKENIFQFFILPSFHRDLPSSGRIYCKSLRSFFFGCPQPCPRHPFAKLNNIFRT